MPVCPQLSALNCSPSTNPPPDFLQRRLDMARVTANLLHAEADVAKEQVDLARHMKEAAGSLTRRELDQLKVHTVHGLWFMLVRSSLFQPFLAARVNYSSALSSSSSSSSSSCVPSTC